MNGWGKSRGVPEIPPQKKAELRISLLGKSYFSFPLSDYCFSGLLNPNRGQRWNSRVRSNK